MTGENLRAALCAAVLAGLSLTSAASAAIVIETVPVGDVGNVADSTGYGQVNYAYSIGKYEVTAGQYAEFLNAVARTDTFSLYNTNMSRTDFGSGITRTGASGSYSYTVDANYVSRPVNSVSFWDSCRFANWLSNGQPAGAQGAGTTETGTYTLTTTGMNNNTITRNPSAGDYWAVTSENEWYKAAYYKGGSENAGYFMFPTASDTAPGRDLNDASGNNANYRNGGTPYPILSGKYTTIVGEFQNSDSPYGTFDQGGNMYEWNEAIIFGTGRGLRGGEFGASSDLTMRATFRIGAVGPTDESDTKGLRVSYVPEPGALFFLTLAGFGAPLRRESGSKSRAQ